MPVFPNQRRTHPRGPHEKATPPTPLTFVDTPTMDYVKWLNASPLSIATFNDDPSTHRVAVIGSGGAGLAAAYELLRCGLDVTLYEATHRLGGRLFASPSTQSQDGNWFEMGAMRFTPSEQVLHYYATLFSNSGASTIQFDPGGFPDPGSNLTYVAFQNQTYHWPAGGSPSGLPYFDTVNNGWDTFLNQGFTSADNTIQLVAPNTITTWLANPQPNVGNIQKAWSGYIQAFVNSSFYEAVVRIFTDPHAPGGVWKQGHLELFGALGTGFGGFGPLFPICFLDIMRFVINAVDSDQHQLTTGTQSLVNGFLDQPITLPDKSTTTLRPRIVLNKPVKGIVSTSPLSPKGGSVTLSFQDNTQLSFDRVIVATSHRSMELTLGLGVNQNGLPLAEEVSDAIRRVHLENSSKVFVETARFWDAGLFPRNVIGDTLLRNLYTLVYPDAPLLKGVLLFSYTWGDDSVKQQSFTDPQQRLQLMLGDLKTISSDLGATVEQVIDKNTAQVIDWQSTPYYYGAFKLNQPGQDAHVRDMFYDFQKAGQSTDTGVYIAGDSVGFLGGWVENAFQTGLNAAAAVTVSLGGTLTSQDKSPFSQLSASLYDYDIPPAGT
jgi:tryptophan 2-monooxygenase